MSRGPGWRYWLVGLLSGIGFGFLVFLSGDSPVAAAVAGVVWAVAFPVLFRVLSTRVAKRGERDA